MELYLCYECLWPVCFPYAQKMHIGTGWHCWRKYREERGSRKFIKFEFNTPKDKLNRLYKDALTVYSSIKNNPEKSPMIKFLKKQVQYNRGDVVQKFLTYLIRNKERELDSELCKFFNSKNWDNFINRQLDKNSQQQPHRKRQPATG